MDILTGIGLASSAGLNAYIPLLAAGLMARYTDLLVLGSGWQWLENPWVLGTLGVLLAIEFLADKIPVVDSVNDVIQTVVRPTSGGIAFGATGSTITTADLSAAAESGGSGGDSVWMLVAGAAIALVFHGLKALARPVVNAVTGGVGAPVVSTAEDTASAVVSVLAIAVPFLVLLLVPLLVMAAVWLRRRAKRRRALRAARDSQDTRAVP